MQKKSLKTQTDKHSLTINNSIPIAKNKTEAAIPKNADLYLRTKLTYNPDNTVWYFPPNSVIHFVKANKICPELVCVQEFQDVTIHKYPDRFPLSGTLKIEDKKGSTAGLLSSKLFETLWVGHKDN